MSSAAPPVRGCLGCARPGESANASRVSRLHAKVVAAGNTGGKEWLSYALTERLSGSGGYQTHAHASLGEFGSHAAFEDDPSVTRWEQSSYERGCMAKNVSNASAKTCASDKRDANNNFYRFASGHEYWDSTYVWEPNLTMYIQCNSDQCHLSASENAPIIVENTALKNQLNPY